MTAAPGRVSLLGLEVDRVTEAGAIATILRGLEQGRGGAVATPNLDHLQQLARRPELAELFEQADLVVADGMPLVWASRLQGSPLPERVAGSDLVWSLTAEAALRDRSVFLLGGAPGACEAAEARLRAVYPGARFAGHLCPPLGFEHDEREVERIRATLAAAQPDIVYVALGFPKQERLIAYLRGEFPRAWFLGVGFSLSFVSGQSSRAPVWMSRLGLEWIHRLAKEPRRLARRYLVHDLPFALRLFWSALRGRRGRGRVPAVRQTTEAARVVFPYGAIERERARLLEELMRPE
jgi:N-acetylglucosaminyldiphosphoundecaprenol N-acetyl-beta-D-mannosaminyltransferase